MKGGGGGSEGTEGALQMKGRWESNINVWFQWNETECLLYFQNRIIMLSPPISKLMYLWAIYTFHGSDCLFCCSQIGRPILGIYCIHRSQLRECRNWDWGRALSFLGLPSSDFLCSEEATVEKRSGRRNNGWKQDWMKEDEEQRWRRGGGGVVKVLWVHCKWRAGENPI